ncbi:hypothetical protein BFW38_14020 [Terasakiispira papahanaumokuakeensis]|uniref:Abasic site processing protein n=1 Tax=Terasakiispira papahanaumokuakeensis TaxID=197479 RepID=A0A1E2VBZ8_9GAMM|nr:SOS response-associated peptidase family protein [Terasakiispira papahanaumokuakeensis]ODC04484.1 hypothetical protein BFW38_14020 [Terasakiispira papahanaumokuakeensis]
MSGRLIITPFNPEQLFGQTVKQMASLKTGFNLPPRQMLSLIRQGPSHLVMDDAFWAYSPAWLRPLNKAPYTVPIENLDTKPMYRESWPSRPALLPVTGYYQWQQLSRHKLPYAVRIQHNRPFLLAAIWTRYPVAPGRHYDSFAIISKPAPDALSHLNLRAPACIHSDQALAWLSEQSAEQRHQLLKEAAVDLEYYPVSPLVNDPHNQSARVAMPVGERHAINPA